MIQLRAPRPEDLATASALCLRSKASWGYDADFLDACAAELTLTENDLAHDPIILARDRGRIIGLAQVARDDSGVFLEKLFVDPDRFGRGIGRRLFRWACLAAARLGPGPLIIDSDPGAVPFYRAMGCRAAGHAPSGSIPGRVLPRLFCDLPALPAAYSISRLT